jgi:hypothetical protein
MMMIPKLVSLVVVTLMTCVSRNNLFFVEGFQSIFLVVTKQSSILHRPSKAETTAATPTTFHRYYYLQLAKNDDDDDIPNDDESKTKNNKNKINNPSLDDLLDRQFFDPNEYDYDDESDTSWKAKFARLVQTDYELAETLYVGVVGCFLIILSQELLRFQMYGQDYVPFMKGSAGMSGKLF